MIRLDIDCVEMRVGHFLSRGAMPVMLNEIEDGLIIVIFGLSIPLIGHSHKEGFSGYDTPSNDLKKLQMKYDKIVNFFKD